MGHSGGLSCGSLSYDPRRATGGPRSRVHRQDVACRRTPISVRPVCKEDRLITAALLDWWLSAAASSTPAPMRCTPSYMRSTSNRLSTPNAMWSGPTDFGGRPSACELTVRALPAHPVDPHRRQPARQFGHVMSVRPPVSGQMTPAVPERAMKLRLEPAMALRPLSDRE